MSQYDSEKIKTTTNPINAEKFINSIEIEFSLKIY